MLKLDGIEDYLDRVRVAPFDSDPTVEDTDKDGWNDDMDKRPLINDWTRFGTEEYINDVKTQAEDISARYTYEPIELDEGLVKALKEYGFTPDADERRTAQLAIKIMMNDINTCNIDENVKFSDNWTDFCKFFNENVKTYGYISEELHYFRLKLNRAPATLDEMIDDINSNVRSENKWIMCSPYKGRFHMFGETGAYNIKFISSDSTDNMFEAVYDINGNLITEEDDFGKNMGTYNYASSFREGNLHNKFYVDTYEQWGNTLNDPIPIRNSWDKNICTNANGETDKYSHPADKDDPERKAVDAGALIHFYDVCGKIGINYSDLQEQNFSIKT